MWNKFKHINLILVLLLLVSCNTCTKKKEKSLVKAAPEWLVDSDALATAIENDLKMVMADTHVAFPYDTMFGFYYKNKFQSVWLPAFENEDNFDRLLNFVNAYALEEGLHGKWYFTDTLEQIKQKVFASGEPDYGILAIAERLMSIGILRLHKDHVFGRVDPKVVLGNNYMLPKRKVENFNLLSVLSYTNLKKEIKKHEIQHESYTLYKGLLKSWHQLKADSTMNWEEIDFGEVVKIGPDSVTNKMPQIANKLFQMGIITKEEAKLADSFIYNKEFAPLIKRAQTSFGLMDDGILGRKTFKIINTTIESRIEDIQVNMERCRWFLKDTTQKCIWVNIPNFTLVANYIDSTKEMAVCVGKPKQHDFDEKMKKYQKTQKWYDKPKDHSTPQIYAKIKFMVLNPTWTVPSSIVQREMYWKMRRDSSYLRRNNYRVYYKKEELNPDTIKWHKYKATNLPFRFVQAEGDHNALGKVKFIFYNPFSIYLHDTPQKSKFKWTERAVSHGCVRVSEPFQVAEFLLKENKKVNYDDFRIKLGEEPLDEERLEEWDPLDSLAEIQPIDSTEIIYLHERVPIYFLYNTIFFNEFDLPVFRNDVYGYNKLIYKAMLQEEE